MNEIIFWELPSRLQLNGILGAWLRDSIATIEGKMASVDTRVSTLCQDLVFYIREEIEFWKSEYLYTLREIKEIRLGGGLLKLRGKE